MVWFDRYLLKKLNLEKKIKKFDLPKFDLPKFSYNNTNLGYFKNFLFLFFMIPPSKYGAMRQRQQPQ